MDQEVTMSLGGNSGLESGPNCDSSVPSSRCSAPFRAPRLKQFNPTVTKSNGHVTVGYPTATKRYVEVEVDVGWRLVGVGDAGGVTRDRYELEAHLATRDP